MTQYTGKAIYADPHFGKEIAAFPGQIQKIMWSLISELAEYGFLDYPNAKKLASFDLFETRVNKNGAWRCMYCYPDYDHILLLSAFQKKTDRTPTKEIVKAQNRLNNFKSK